MARLVKVKTSIAEAGAEAAQMRSGRKAQPTGTALASEHAAPAAIARKTAAPPSTLWRKAALVPADCDLFDAALFGRR